MSKKILIVDDEKEICELIKFRLEDKGFAVYQANSGEEALKILEEKNIPDLILLDINMAGMSGLELCERIKSNDDFKKIKLILLTSLGSNEDKQKGLDAGADYYFHKPFRTGNLINKIEELTG